MSDTHDQASFGPPVPEGKQIGDFRIVREIGRGGMGVVYLAEQVSLGRRVALKILPPHISLSERQIERFQREAGIAARLVHPNIVPIYTVDHADGMHFYSMEFIEGPDLARRIEELEREHERSGGDLSALSLGLDGSPGYPAEVAALIAQIADALDHAHHNGIIHRDVKPHNIILDRAGTPHVLDFGLAKDTGGESISAAGDITGTYQYMSPEQALAKRVKVDHRSDIFSLGVVLYQLLTMRVPFQGRSMQQVLYAISFNEAPPPRKLDPRIPRDLETICMKAIEKNPSKRFDSAGELAADLRRFLRFEPIRAQRAGVVGRTAKWVRRNRWPSAALLIVALAVVVVAALAVKFERDARRELNQRAEARARSGDDARETYDQLDRAIAATRGEIDVLRAAIQGHEGTDAKLPLWEKEDELRELVGRQLTARAEMVAAYEDALAILGRPDEELHRKLTAFYFDRYDEATAAGDRTTATALREDILRLDRSSEVTARLDADGSLTLDSEPSGVEVFVFRYVERYRRLWPCPYDPRAHRVIAYPDAAGAASIPIGSSVHVSPSVLAELVMDDGNRLGRTPVERHALPPGSYLIVLRSTDRRDVLYPVVIERGTQYATATPIAMHNADETPGPQYSYIAGGRSILGGDSGAFGGTSRRTAEIEAFFISTTEVSNEAYLRFLNDRSYFEERGGDAALHAPRFQKDGESFWPRTRRGVFQLPQVNPQAPVNGISWSSAREYAKWRTHQAGILDEPWVFELPTDSQWERAARGADGRTYPWGNLMDWTFCQGARSTMRSLQQTPQSFWPADESPFGVRNLAGAVREHCLDDVQLAGDTRTSLRGGSFTMATDINARCASRAVTSPDEPNLNYGLRLVATPRVFD